MSAPTPENSSSPNLAASGRDKFLNALLAMFSLGSFTMYYLTIPLWAIELDASPLLIGIAVGIRPLLPAILSIHGGALMDRLGVRKVLIVSGIIGVVTPLGIIAFPTIGMLIFLQFIGGLSEGLGWLGAQTRLAQVSKGDTDAAGWFTGAGKFGTLIAPVIAGLVWDQLGPVAAFITTAVWAVALLLTVLLLPKLKPLGDSSRSGFSASELLPRWSDYRKALELLAIPLVAVVCLGTFLRLSAFGVQGSFYPVYLESIGITGSVIGVLIGFASFTGTPSAIAAPWIARRLGTMQVMFIAVLMSVIGVTAPPLVTSTVMLFVLAGLFGIGVGLTLPLMLSLLSKATPEEHQGVSAGLRATVNRLGNLVVPILMGGLVQFFGLTVSFIVIGVLLTLGTGITILYAMKHRLFDTSS